MIVRSCCRAVAIIIRSAGSFGGVPGRSDELIRMSAVNWASLTNLCSVTTRNQSRGGIGSLSRPRATSSPISHAVVVEINTGRPMLAHRSISDTASGAMASPFADHNTAQVSSRMSDRMVRQVWLPCGKAWVGWLRQVVPIDDFHRALQTSEQRMGLLIRCHV